MKLLLIAAGLLTAPLFSLTLIHRDEPRPVLIGRYDCGGGRIVIAHGDGGPKEFLSFDAAARSLRESDYSPSGVDALQTILRQTCAEDFDPGPKRAVEGGAQQGRRDPSWRGGDARSVSLVYLKKIEKEIAFAVFDVEAGELSMGSSNANMDGRDRARAVGDYVSRKGKTTCRPISSVCVKCSDGTIVCGAEKIK